jgi:hypothetical protein
VGTGTREHTGTPEGGGRVNAPDPLDDPLFADAPADTIARANGDTPIVEHGPETDPGYWASIDADARAHGNGDQPAGAQPAAEVRSREGKRSARDRIVELAEECYTIGRTEDDRTFVVPIDGPNVALFSGPAKANLAARYRECEGRAVGRTPLDEAWVTIEGLAPSAAKAPLPLRVAAADDGCLVIDMGDVSGRCVVVTGNGWRIEARSPVTFRRSKAMLPLPEPTRGGELGELFELLPFAARSRDLYTAWLTLALFEHLPRPAPVFRGEQGSAKSTTARGSSRLLDPCMADTQKPPKDESEWSQACSARWVVAVDNVSGIPSWWSDALCRTITGDGWIRRQLYTDDDVIVTKWRRCVILNGITLGGSLRPDLAERLLFFDLERPASYLTEDEVNTRLDAMAPRVLGVLLDRAAATLAVLPATKVPRDLRMADFAHHLAAYDTAHGTDTLGAYRLELDAAFAEALDADPVATAVIEFMDGRDEWTGSVSDLLRVLVKPPGDGLWPASPDKLSGWLARSTPTLRRVGIQWQRPKKSTLGKRTARLTRISGASGASGASFPLVVSAPLSTSPSPSSLSHPANTTKGGDAPLAPLAPPDDAPLDDDSEPF